jgi:aminoglycoside 3-N-acetyltransferase
VQDHALDFPSNIHTSPLGKLSSLPGSLVLLLGVSWDRNSSFHVAEQLSGCFGQTREGCPWLDEDGNKIWKEFDAMVTAEDDLLQEVGAAFESARADEIWVGKVGFAACRLFSCADCIRFTVEYYQTKGISIQD